MPQVPERANSRPGRLYGAGRCVGRSLWTPHGDGVYRIVRRRAAYAWIHLMFDIGLLSSPLTFHFRLWGERDIGVGKAGEGGRGPAGYGVGWGTPGGVSGSEDWVRCLGRIEGGHWESSPADNEAGKARYGRDGAPRGTSFLSHTLHDIPVVHASTGAQTPKVHATPSPAPRTPKS